MLRFFRKFARSWVSAIIIGLIIIFFAVSGNGDLFQAASSDSVAKVAGKNISQAEYRAEFERFLKRAKSEAKRDVSTEEARKQGLDNAVLEQMVGNRAFAALTESLGIRASSKTVQSEIAKIPGFQDPYTQRFSVAAYENALRENGFTVPQFEETVRDDLSRQSLTLAASSGFRAPRVFASQTLAYGTERRMVTIIPVPVSLVGAPGKPTAAQLNELYIENREALTRPETRSITVAIASAAEFEAKATIDEAEAVKIFERNKANLSKPATRSLVQIIATDKAKADQAAARMRAGEEPIAIAKSLGLAAPIVLANVATTGIPDVKVSKAAFEMTKGDIAVVVAELQPFAAVKILDITPAIEAKFEDSAAEIRSQLRKAASGELMTDATDAFDKVMTEGGTIEAAAAKAGFKTIKITNIVADGRSIETGQPLALLTDAPTLLRDAFSGAKGDTTELATIPGDRYAALHIDNVTPAAPPPISQITQELTNEWIRRDMASRVELKAKELLAEAQRTSLEAAAAKFKLPALRQQQPLLRGQGGQNLTQAVFGAKKGSIVMAQSANGVEYTIVRIDDILRDDEAVVPERVVQAETAVRASVQRDIIASLERVARERSKTQLFPKMVGRALGDSAETDAAPTPASTKKP